MGLNSTIHLLLVSGFWFLVSRAGEYGAFTILISFGFFVCVSFAVKAVGYAQDVLFRNVGGFSTMQYLVCRSLRHGGSIVCTYLWDDARLDR